MPRTRQVAKIVARVSLIAISGLRAPPTRAQELEAPRGRQGYFLGAGVRGTYQTTMAKDLPIAEAPGTGLTIRFGQLLTRAFGLGLVVDQASAAAPDRQSRLASFSLEGSVVLTGTLAATAAAGLGFVRLESPEDAPEARRGGFGACYGVGLTWDLFPWRRLSGGLALSPTAQVRVFPNASAWTSAAFVGVDLLWWTGLPRGQLELPERDAYDDHDGARRLVPAGPVPQAAPPAPASAAPDPQVGAGDPRGR